MPKGFLDSALPVYDDTVFNIITMNIKRQIKVGWQCSRGGSIPLRRGYRLLKRHRGVPPHLN